MHPGNELNWLREMSPDDRAIWLCRSLITRKAAVEQVLRQARRYEDFCDEISRWNTVHLDGDPAQELTAEALTAAADELLGIADRFGLIQSEAFREAQHLRVRGATKTRGPAKRADDRESLFQRLAAVADVFRRSG